MSFQITFEGVTYKSMTALCRAYGISQNTFNDRYYNRHWDIYHCIHGKEKSYEDHLGRKFETIKEMCKTNNVSESFYEEKMSSGWSLEEIFTCKERKEKRKKLKASQRKSGRTVITDHTGNEFPSIIAMCRYWEISRTAFDNRISRGYTLEQALTEPKYRSSKGKKKGPVPVVDPKGIIFHSIKAMCDAWNCPYALYMSRKEIGWTDIEALTGERVKNTMTDHEGNKFYYMKDMCEFHGVTTQYYKNRIKEGYTQKEALTKPKERPVKDFLGHSFYTEEEMCIAWGTTLEEYRSRTGNGWTHREALRGVKKSITDPYGNTFKSASALCRAYGFSTSSFYRHYHDENLPVEEIFSIMEKKDDAEGDAGKKYTREPVRTRIKKAAKQKEIDTCNEIIRILKKSAGNCRHVSEVQKYLAQISTAQA